MLKKDSIDKESSKVFLVFNTAFFGDVLLCNSLCQNIKAIYPDSKIVFIVAKNFYDVARYQKDVDDVITIDKNGKHKGFFGLLKFVKEFKYKNIYASFITYHNMRNFLISRLLKVKHVITAPKYKKAFPTQEKHNNLLKKHFNIEVKNYPVIYDTQKIDIKWDTLKSKLELNDDYIVLSVLTKRLEKNMPITTAQGLINMITSNLNKKVVLVGVGEDCEKYSKELLNLGCNFINLVNKTSIPELSLVLKYSKGLISVDTGTMHLGYAVGAPTVCIFYKKDTIITWGPNPNLYKVKLITDDYSAEHIFENTKDLLKG